jgi:Skp family chaperone for outer membrane proteins
MMKRLLLPVLLGLALTASAAEKPEEGAPPKTDSADVRKEVGEAVDAVAAKARQERDEFVVKAQKEMAELNKKMAELRKKAKKLGGEAKARLDRQIREMEPERKAAEQKLADLKSATEEKWEELKTGVSSAIDRLTQAMQKDGEEER